MGSDGLRGLRGVPWDWHWVRWIRRLAERALLRYLAAIEQHDALHAAESLESIGRHDDQAIGEQATRTDATGHQVTSHRAVDRCRQREPKGARGMG